MSAPRPFSMVESKYDQSTYFGRVRRFVEAVNPMALFYTSKDVDEATNLIDAWRQNNCKCPEGITDADLWKARGVRDAVLHPDTQEPVPWPFRMCAFVPVNIPIAGGMILATSTGPQLFFQWLNQSYNSGFNYANRNATVAVNQNEILVSYGLAVTVACGSAFVGGRLAARLSQRAGISPMTKMAVNRVVPWFAVAAAGSFNALAMRYKEATDGIEVRDGDGTLRGVSRSAGVAVLSQIVATRVVLPIPVILLPPFLSDAVRSVGIVGRAIAASAAIGLAVDLAVITACLWLALPLAIAIFPQDASLPVASLEPEFRGLLDSKGEAVTHLTCNKGV